MEVKERYLATYNHEPTDRIPIALSYFHAGFGRNHFSPLSEGQDPVEARIRNQLRYGFDPHQYVRGTGKDWFLAQPTRRLGTSEGASASDGWRVTQTIIQQPTGMIRTEYAIETSGGDLSCVRFQTPDDFGTIEEPFIKEEADIDLLRYRPHPRHVIDLDLIRRDHRVMGDRCWPMASFAGVWTLASFFRGPERIMYDCYDRPEWVKRFLGVLADYQVELVKEIARAGVDVTLRMDGSFVGFGLSRGMYTEFIQRHDTAIVQAGHDAGLRVHLHICGKKNG